MTTTQDPTELHRQRLARQDPTLTHLAHLSNVAEGFQVPIILSVGGVQVSGVMVGAKQYFSELIEHIRETGNGDGVDGFAKIFEAVTEDMTSTDSGSDDETPLTPADFPGHLHLTDASVYGGPTVLNLGFWRGRITAVDGWTIGQLHD
ncbi:hypothetical protein GS966_19945 [Rhodococcus hoagii]|nr:hypothetical protein [Prescottella equi]NKS73149.1 hypothetical protein [Prescottella equi]NKZ92199.1 hypothetical protein [Prescottella equi]